MSITILGEKSKTIFLKGVEAHKLHHEFTVAPGFTVKRGQPVKLLADGTIKACTGSEKNMVIIGISIHNGSDGELVTVAMKAFAILYAMPNAGTVAGPVKYDGLNSTDDDYNSYVALVDGGELAGWALDKAGAADEMIRVAVI